MDDRTDNMNIKELERVVTDQETRGETDRPLHCHKDQIRGPHEGLQNHIMVWKMS